MGSSFCLPILVEDEEFISIPYLISLVFVSSKCKATGVCIGLFISQSFSSSFVLNDLTCTKTKFPLSDNQMLKNLTINFKKTFLIQLFGLSPSYVRISFQFTSSLHLIIFRYSFFFRHTTSIVQISIKYHTFSSINS